MSVQPAPEFDGGPLRHPSTSGHSIYIMKYVVSVEGQPFSLQSFEVAGQL